MLTRARSALVYANDFDWAEKNRGRILAEWQKRDGK